MKRIFPFCLVVAACFSPALAQTSSEVPLENPEVLEPPSRQQDITPAPDAEVSRGEAESADQNRDMTFEKLVRIVRALDDEAVVRGNGMMLTVSDTQITIVTDPRANRMRAFTAFKTLDGVSGQNLYRMMQSNFDAALDARYAIAQGHLISVFIHPLAELRKEQFIHALVQVVSLVKTYGTAYSSSGMTFGGGDSNQLHKKLIEELLKKGERI